MFLLGIGTVSNIHTFSCIGVENDLKRTQGKKNKKKYFPKRYKVNFFLCICIVPSYGNS